MILIDTNVISELMRPNPAPAVLAWFGVQDTAVLHISAVGEAELRRGAAVMSEGKRRSRLIAEIDAMITEDFAGRVLPFDSVAAQAFATIFVDRRAAGRPISFPDCQIAATARAHGAAIATRNVTDFTGCGVEVIDPWKHGA
ncbi:plasmid stabilization protein [Ectothiorhodospira haloalkaliphila]|uniref:Ribonuclease VapC n=1 Tax=Ectothiorhodospira haloalkaliphila TaxID=421628 RepID=W8KJE9_9GAMM|nr:MULTISPECIES: type II toxin-antitoxin system VapC family toxin [Ectothiorhodospira]AHK79924.1 plasmid stabilization protein [Ectothiorhodospira haloalkaliphila]MCG5493567.1 type II toxin-antitoxin system VapC family toxin [Ectothiorhodospira variabilis]MCG5502896.1 type II toxin-antitoxin system VapC family toxin [Ectothiorhodospira variabilis]MCG5506316.1 type II toxin-antitoxin system VapC family toxin [Ectothiorhodospira variabilis]